jgi:hypothetical protein
MVRANFDDNLRDEEILAQFTQAAYQVALQFGLKAPFVDVELGLWHALQEAAAELPGEALVLRKPLIVERELLGQGARPREEAAWPA